MRALKIPGGGLEKTPWLQFSQHILARLCLLFGSVQVGVQSDIITALLPLVPEVVDQGL